MSATATDSSVATAAIATGLLRKDVGTSSVAAAAGLSAAAAVVDRSSGRSERERRSTAAVVVTGILTVTAAAIAAAVGRSLDNVATLSTAAVNVGASTGTNTRCQLSDEVVAQLATSQRLKRFRHYVAVPV